MNAVGRRLSRSTLVAGALRFVMLSGAGWLLDLSLLLLLVGVLRLPSGTANIVSSLTAATAVFLISRRRIFAARGRTTPRALVYIVYTVGVILLASAALARVVATLATYPGLAASLTGPGMTAIAKIIVTPPQLVANFAVARWLNEWTPKLASGHA